MMLHLPAVLSKQQVAQCREVLDAAQWVDGNTNSSAQSAQATRNQQLPEGSTAARAIGDAIQDALGRNARFFSAALPLKVFPPLFNRYSRGDGVGTHVDNAMRQLRGTNFRIRSDLSATLFLAEPDTYDGGELCIEDTYGMHRAKLPAGDLVLYPASSPHRLSPVTRGVRVASFFWIESMVRDDGRRATLFQLDHDVQTLSAQRGLNDATVVSLTGIYHNLLRRWADA
ncbi:Fe2+-dependent dioxygenase [Paraburkholderia sp.]|uniref:Fe2+-dependent dioxygenase n=1 Tax=Paraburkholderia sp. TaxID=1926495 RepID=UPI002F3F5A98